jgi:tetratricopeptide (TPR) repeat protein
MAGAALILGVAFARMDTWAGIASEIRREPGGYLATPYLSHRYCAPGIRFLKEAALQGNLFNPYHVGGYAGYRLSPRIRIFIDGRTEHYPTEVMRDYLEIIRAAAWPDRRAAFQILDKHEVDLFLGAGLPEGYYSNLYTVELVARNPGWILVYRTIDHAVYLRRNPRNLDNLTRIAAYYRARGVPFDSQTGFRPRQVIRNAPNWAIAQGMIPPNFLKLEARRESESAEERFRALDSIGNVYWLLGDRRAQIEADLAAAAVRPDARDPRRRLADTYLRQRRFKEAEALARELYESDPSDARTRMLYEYMLARRYAR